MAGGYQMPATDSVSSWRIPPVAGRVLSSLITTAALNCDGVLWRVRWSCWGQALPRVCACGSAAESENLQFDRRQFTTFHSRLEPLTAAWSFGRKMKREFPGIGDRVFA